MPSKIFDVENFIAFCEYLVSLSSQIKFFSDVAHVKQLLAVFLEKERTDIEVSEGDSDDEWPPDHGFGDKNSPAEQYISDKEGIAESFQDNVIVILSRE